MRTPIIERMMARVEPVPEAGCWLYTGSTDGRGYGTVATEAGKAPARAHRVSFQHYVGPIPAGLDVCHKCDTPRCVNPDHLFIGSRYDNMRDCARKGRLNPASTLNLRPGHPGYYGAGPSKKENEIGSRNQ